MQLRSGGPIEPAARPTSASWRIPRQIVALKLGGAVVLAGIALLGGYDPRRTLVAGLAAAVLAVFAVRDLVAPMRLAADQDGITVVEWFARRRRLPWSQVEAVRVDARSRYGLRSEQLEVDIGETLYVFGQSDLGAPVADVADAITAIRGPR